MARPTSGINEKNAHDLCHMGDVRRAIAKGVPADIDGQVAFVMDQFDGAVRPIQDRHEITELLRRVRALVPRTVLEIGTARGGTLFLLCQSARDDATVISLELPCGTATAAASRGGRRRPTACSPNRAKRWFFSRSNSHDRSSFEAVERHPGRVGSSTSS